jgi:hypothetical protein
MYKPQHLCKKHIHVVGGICQTTKSAAKTNGSGNPIVLEFLRSYSLNQSIYCVQALKLHVEPAGLVNGDGGPDDAALSLSKNQRINRSTISLDRKKGRRAAQNWSSTAYTIAVTGAAVVVGVSVLTYLKKATP